MKRGSFLAAFLAAPGVAHARTEIKKFKYECRRCLALWLAILAMRLTPSEDAETQKRFRNLFRAMSS